MSGNGQNTLTSVSADLLEPDRRYRKNIIYTIAATLCCGVAWSAFTNVIEVSAGVGQVIPERRLQVVQNLEGGSVQSILVKRGDTVKEGQVMVLLDPTVAKSELQQSLEQLAGLEAASIRLQAMMRAVEHSSAALAVPLPATADAASPPGTRTAFLRGLSEPGLMELAATLPVFPEQLRRNHPQLVQQNSDQYRTGLTELAKSLSSFEQQISQRESERAETQSRLASTSVALGYAMEELKALEKLLRSGAAGRGEVIAAKAKVNELRGLEQQLALSTPRFDAAVAELQDKREERLNNFRSRISEMLTETEIKRASFKATLQALEQRAAKTEVRASASGVVKTMKVSATGQVVKPGEDIAEIVPADGSLLIQVRIRPEDIAFVEPGMPALIKLTAFDFSIFGAIPGKVDQIASDSNTDERGTTYYLVDVRALADHVERRGERWPIKAGMVANVDIVTGKRTIFQYLTKPIHRMTNMALRER